MDHNGEWHQVEVTPTACQMCGHLMDEHKPSAHFPGMVACQECIIDSTVCLVKTS
jgi:hypothetical protein